MGKKEEKIRHGKLPNVYRDGLVVPQPAAELHTQVLGGHPIHPARFPKGKRFK